MSSGSFSHETEGHDEYGGYIIGDSMEHSLLRQLQLEIGPAETDAGFLYRTRPEFDRSAITERMDALLVDAHFMPAHKHWRLAQAVGNFVVRKGSKVKHYAETLADAEARSGRPEAATFGTAEFGGQRCAVFAMNWSFLGGSVGEVVGEKFMAAARLAEDKKLPFVAFYTSGGMRQHENAYALAQMTRSVDALTHYLQETNMPHIAVLFGQVWGGTSASTVPLADTVIGVAGSDFGFAGPRVIENYQKSPVPPGSQSVEANYLERGVDVVVPYEGLSGYIGEYLRVAKPPAKISKEDRIPPATQRELWSLKHPVGRPRQLKFGAEGLAPPLKVQQAAMPGEMVEIPPPRPNEVHEHVADTLLANYQRLATDVGRLDGDFLLHNVFDEVVPLYTHYRRGNQIVYPPVVGAYVRIDNQLFMGIANQPSYELRASGGLRKILATPRPQDYQHFVKLMEVAKRRGLPVITFTDTLGAAPTIDSEIRGQSEWIARAIAATTTHTKPVISIVTGALGSGGGLATTALSPRLMAFDDGMIYVAEPGSAASIVYGTPEPSRDQVQETLAGMDSSAAVLHELGFVSRVIPTSEEPMVTVQNARQAIMEEYHSLSEKSERQLRRMARFTLEHLRRGEIANR